MKIATLILALACFAPHLHAADIVLPAKTAALNGKEAIYDDAPGYKCIRHWKNTNITASWKFEVPKKAAYRVFMTYACPPDLIGSEIEITAGTQRATGIVQSSGGWNRYKEFDLGPLIFRKTGPLEIVIRATRINRGTAWDLQSMRLVPEN